MHFHCFPVHFLISVAAPQHILEQARISDPLVIQIEFLLIPLGSRNASFILDQNISISSFQQQHPLHFLLLLP